VSAGTDPAFYRSPADAIAAPPERLAYVAAFDPAGKAKDAMAVLDCDPNSSAYGGVVGWSELPTAGNELHHFGWNACSSALCHAGHGDHGQPWSAGTWSSPASGRRGSMCSTPNPTPATPRWSTRSPPRSWPPKAGYSRPHTIHCGPGGIYLFSLGGANGHDGPGGVALLDHDSFEVTGPWELDRGDQYFAYDGWWHLNHDTMITSEWGSPSMFEHGLDPEDLLGRRFGHHLNFWSMSQRRLTQRIDLGDAHQLVFEVRPAHDPAKAWGFVGVVTSVEDLSGSVWAWHRDGDRWAATKVITIAESAFMPPLSYERGNLRRECRSVPGRHLASVAPARPTTASREAMDHACWLFSPGLGRNAGLTCAHDPARTYEPDHLGATTRSPRQRIWQLFDRIVRWRTDRRPRPRGCREPCWPRWPHPARCRRTAPPGRSHPGQRPRRP
jgi:56kDa selenium binding protein (SBP56)